MKDSKGIFLMLGAVIIVLLALTILSKNPNGKQFSLQSFLPSTSSNTPSTPAPNLKEITIGNTAVMVQIANTEPTREKGLGGVSQLPSDQGMLFVFDSKQITPSFWMKGMLIPLDFIWISGGRVAQIDTNIAAPAPNTPDNQLKVYSPSVPVDEVLEVNSGFALKNLIKVGDLVALGN